MFSKVEKCRICNSTDLDKYLNLGDLPLANNLVEPGKQDKDPVFPLETMLCNNCKLSQLTVIVDPEVLFSEYSYRTSISSTFQKHFEQLAIDLKEHYFENTSEVLALDIASNDGCLLEQFKKHNYQVLGVDPAQNLAKIANEKGLTTIPLFWNEEAVAKVLEKGKPKVITASNVFAHVDDVHGFIQNVKKVIDPEGMFIVEVPHALNLIEKNEFDTIYHEHLSYFLVKPMKELFEMGGMEIFDVQKIPIHGGSIRVFAKLKENKKFQVNSESINQILKEEEEKKLYSIERYQEFAEKSNEVKQKFIEMIQNLKSDGKSIAGYGAAAKASTLLNFCGLGKEIEFIIDDAPSKQNKCFAGNRVPIVPASRLDEHPDYLVIFAWTIAKEIMEKNKGKYNGKYIIPMPNPKIID